MVFSGRKDNNNGRNVIVSLFVAALFLITSQLFAQTGLHPAWYQLETEKTILFYRNTGDLEKFNTLIDFQNQTSQKKNALAINLEEKIDSLFLRVSSILGMTKKFKKVRIHIYPDKNQMDQIFNLVHPDAPLVRAWYEYEKNTIYINLDDLNEGMLAHELAHAVIDHNLLIPPPVNSAEILARYVDNHLLDRAEYSSVHKDRTAIKTFSDD